MVRALGALALAAALFLFPSVSLAEEVSVDSSGADSGSVQSVPVDSVPSDGAVPEVSADGSPSSDSGSAGVSTLYDSDGDVLASPTLVQDRRVSGTPYASVSGGTYEGYAAQVVAKLGKPLDDYLFYRSGSYTYVLCMGDLTLSGSTFTGSACDVVTFSRSSSFDGYGVEFSTEDVEVNVGDYIVCSNLGNYPQLDVGLARVELLLWVCAALLAVHFVCKPVFTFVLRDAPIDLRGTDNHSAVLPHLAEGRHLRYRDVLALKRVPENMKLIQKKNHALRAVVHLGNLLIAGERLHLVRHARNAQIRDYARKRVPRRHALNGLHGGERLTGALRTTKDPNPVGIEVPRVVLPELRLEVERAGSVNRIVRTDGRQFHFVNRDTPPKKKAPRRGGPTPKKGETD